MTLESIQWRGVHVEKPDSETVVLIYRPQAHASERVWLGFRSRHGDWFAVGARPVEGVTHWAEMPKGAV